MLWFTYFGRPACNDIVFFLKFIFKNSDLILELKYKSTNEVHSVIVN